MATPIPSKPYLMRWHTYLRVRAEITTLESEVVSRLDR